MTKKQTTEILSERLSSSNLEQVDYDTLMNTMTLKFRAGYCYEYYGVPKEVFDQLVTAESAGKFFHSNIRNKFEFAKRGSVQELPHYEETW